jgi:hypothetical protein
MLNVIPLNVLALITFVLFLTFGYNDRSFIVRLSIIRLNVNLLNVMAPIKFV